MRWGVLCFVALAGCVYDEPTITGDDMPPPPGGGNPDGGSNPPRKCPVDPSLKLCVDFDGPLSPTVVDGAGHTISSMNVVAMTRAGEPAAHLDATSQLYIDAGAASDLDLT